MNMEWIQLLALVFLTGVLLCALLYGGYTWGRFTGMQALQSHHSKWKAYGIALLPPLAFSCMFVLDQNLSPFAARAFFGLGSPALIGVCVRFHSSVDN